MILECLKEEWKGCTRCGLHATRKRMVFGRGPVDARIVLVGTGPGSAEDDKGSPFIGSAGRKLTLFLKEAMIDIETIYLTNVVCCRPFVYNEKGHKEDRDPTTPEVRACLPRLHELLYLIDPVVIIASGGVALQSLTRVTTGVGAARGKIFPAKIPGRMGEIEIPVLATIHPAALMRNPDISPQGVVAKTIGDYRRAAAIAAREREIYE